MKNVIENESVFIFKLRNCRHRTAQIRRLITAIDVLCQLFRLFFITMLHRITLKRLLSGCILQLEQAKIEKNAFQSELRLLFSNSAVYDVTRYVRWRVSAAPRAVQLGNILIYELKMSNFYTNVMNFSLNLNKNNANFNAVNWPVLSACNRY